MIKQFFFVGSPLRITWAWFGLLTFVGHQAFKAYLSWRLNSWYERFYDLLQTSIQSLELSSGDLQGDFSSGDAFMDARQQVWDRLIEFAWIVAPAVIVNPIAGLIRNWWVFTWRRSLMKTYLRRYNTTIPPLEGTSQRIHEDSQRFANGVQGCVAVVLHSAFTLGIFCPVMYDLDPLLMFIALGVATGCLSISILIGQPLVGLEVNNQKVEAALRKQLVLLEIEPLNSVTGLVPRKKKSRNSTTTHVNWISTEGPNGSYAAFISIFSELTLNYRRLYISFTKLGTWLALYEQAVILLPYLLAAPRLFASTPDTRLSLGQLMKISNSFGRVFDSLNVISDNWLQINEWRSVVRRLAEFERELDSRRPPAKRPVPKLNEVSTTSMEISMNLEPIDEGIEMHKS